jgi:hypothetical protein
MLCKIVPVKKHHALKVFEVITGAVDISTFAIHGICTPLPVPVTLLPETSPQ